MATFYQLLSALLWYIVCFCWSATQLISLLLKTFTFYHFAIGFRFKTHLKIFVIKYIFWHGTWCWAFDFFALSKIEDTFIVTKPDRCLKISVKWNKKFPLWTWKEIFNLQFHCSRYELYQCPEVESELK